MEEALKQAKGELTKIVFFGPESSGKSTLAEALAAEYHTEWVPEYARTYLQQKYDATAEVCAPSDLLPIARGQIQLENKKAALANSYLFCDTCVLQTLTYAQIYYKHFKDSLLERCAREHTYSHYFLTYIDTPWIPDDLRDKPEERHEMFSIFEDVLLKRQLPYTVLTGHLKQRLEKVSSIIKTL